MKRVLLAMEIGRRHCLGCCFCPELDHYLGCRERRKNSINTWSGFSTFTEEEAALQRDRQGSSGGNNFAYTKPWGGC